MVKIIVWLQNNFVYLFTCSVTKHSSFAYQICISVNSMYSLFQGKCSFIFKFISIILSICISFLFIQFLKVYYV
jgi:hypothetical protein